MRQVSSGPLFFFTMYCLPKPHGQLCKRQFDGFVQEVHCTWMHLCYYSNKFLNWDTATPLILIHNLRENISVCCSTIVMFMCTAHTSFSSQVHRFPSSIRIKWLWLGCQPFLHCLPFRCSLSNADSLAFPDMLIWLLIDMYAYWVTTQTSFKIICTLLRHSTHP